MVCGDDDGGVIIKAELLEVIKVLAQNREGTARLANHIRATIGLAHFLVIRKGHVSAIEVNELEGAV